MPSSEYEVFVDIMVAAHCDLFRIAAESRYILLNPPEGLSLCERICQIKKGRENENTNDLEAPDFRRQPVWLLHRRGNRMLHINVG